MKKGLSILFVSLFIFSCKNDNAPVAGEDFEIVMRLDKDPGRLNPMLASSSLTAREIYPYLFLQLAEYNPRTLELEPILAKTLPEANLIEEGEYKGDLQIEVEILEDAVWNDSMPITAKDFEFTLKAVFHPLVNAPSWRSGLSAFKTIILNEEDPKKFTLIIEDELNAKESIYSAEIFPAHVYDPKSILSGVRVDQMMDEEWMKEKLESDTVFVGFANQYNDRQFNIDNMSGAGPYELEEWETDQYISIVRKENWWGHKYPERTFLNANPAKIVFQIIPDEVIALTQLKSGGVDVMTFKDGNQFKNLRENDSLDIEFHTPQLLRYYYIALNNESKKLKDPIVRKALAYCVDVDQFIEKIEYGAGTRLSSTILTSDKFYNDELIEIDKNIAKANEMLDNAGWKDTDGDGNRDKTVDGDLVNLDLRIFVSKSALSNNIALLLKENAAQAGIEVNIIQKAYRQALKENIHTSDYEMMTMVNGQSLATYNPYGRWHSDNAINAGTNVTRYRNPEVDELIELIEDEKELSKLEGYYDDLQEIMFEDQPVVFLYSPQAKIAINKKFEPLISVKRPGYFLNAFKEK